MNGFIMDYYFIIAPVYVYYFIIAPVYVDDLIMPCYNMDKCNNALEQDLKEQFKEKIFGFRNECVLQD